MRFSKKIGFRGLIHEFHRELFQTYFVIETDNKGLKRTKMAYIISADLNTKESE